MKLGHSKRHDRALPWFAARALPWFAALCAALAASPGTAAAKGRARNAIIFVADGLRPLSLNPTDAPTLVRLQSEGVFFPNSHSLYPTFTTANASAIATGHLLGDTGDFANTLYVKSQVGESGTPFIEDDQILAQLDDLFEGNYLGETSLLSVARAHGYSTAAVGKLGPTLVQDVTQGDRGAGVPATIFLDDKTGTAKGVALDPAVAEALKTALGSAAPPSRTNGKPRTPDDNSYPGDFRTPGTRVANVPQQRYLADAVTKVILPLFKRRGKPFVLVFWSRDPDATQHFQGDSLGNLEIGINGPTSRAAVHDADDTLRAIWGAVEADAELAVSTDLFVTSDHGFSTLSRREVAEGRPSTSAATKRRAPDVRPGDLPPGFVAIDVAAHLGAKLCDPDRIAIGVDGKSGYAPVGADEHPSQGNGFIGPSCVARGPRDAQVLVAANGGSDLLYVPDGDRARIADVATFLLGRDYVDAVFVDLPAGAVPGALTLRDINLVGSARTPRPSIVVALKTWSRDPKDPLRSQIDVCDTTLQEGQGMHGSFGRADVSNTMIAVGPDFKRGFVDHAPASNADLPRTLARVLGLTLPSRGKLAGRVLAEALAGGPAATPSTCGEAIAAPNKDGLRTALHFQTAVGVRYLDAAKKLSGGGPASWGEWVDALPCSPPKRGRAPSRP